MTPYVCRKCGQPVSCYPTGHHCPACGHHDDTACASFPEPAAGEHAWYTETVRIPGDLFTTLVTGYQRRNLYRWALNAEGPMAEAIRELAAAHATGSTRLTPMSAYRLAQNLCAIVAGAETDAEDEALFYLVLDQMTPAQRAACRETDETERQAEMAEYRAWRAAQLETQGGTR